MIAPFKEEVVRPHCRRVMDEIVAGVNLFVKPAAGVVAGFHCLEGDSNRLSAECCGQDYRQTG
ncbi:MAG: hypothetical protein HQ546_05290 [Planctomycetes bacterium]|nr:hypothetical protein [Planctomycetota bacterium]